MNQSIPYYFKSNQELLERLESLRPLVKKSDAEALAKHKQEEKLWLKHLRDSIRKQSKTFLALDYDTAKKQHLYSGLTIYARNERGEKVEAPNCPVSQIEIIDRAVEIVKRSSERKWRIKQGGDYHYLHMALSLGIDLAGAVC